MRILSIASNITAMIFAAIAAWLWFKSATIRVPASEGNKTGPEIEVDGYAFIATALKQSSWSRSAALAAAGAALFQAIGLAASLVA